MTSRPVARTQWPVLLSACLLTVLFASVLWSRTFVDFEGVRQKILQQALPATQGEVRVTLPESPRYARMAPPVVIIVKPHNPGDQPIALEIAFNGERLTTETIAPHNDRRIDLVVPHERAFHAGDIITLTAAGAAQAPAQAQAPWSLDYLEVANHHGSSRAILTFFIVPQGTRAYDAPGVLLTATVAVAMLFLLRRGSGLLQTRRARIAQGVLTVVIVVIFAIVLASGTFSAFKLLLTPKSFATCAIAMTWPGLVGAFRDVRGWLAARAEWAPWLFDAVLTACAVAMFYILQMQVLLGNYEGNYSGFLQISKSHADHVPFLLERPDITRKLRIGDGGGYDGQFFYIITYDPFLLAFKDNPVRYRDVVDAPPYRYGRIGFSLLTKIFSGNQPDLYPKTMVWMIIAACFIGALLVAAIAREYGYPPAWALLFVVVPGFVQSLNVTLPEPIAAVGLLGGYLLLRRGHAAWAAALFALSLLIRETGIIFVAAMVVWYALRLRERGTAAIIATSVLPLIAWRAYVGWRLFPDFKWEAFFFNPHNTGMPFQGFAELWGQIRSGQYFSGAEDLVTAGTWYPVLLTLALVVGAYLLWTRRDGLSAAIFAYALLAVSLNYAAIWVHVGNGERGTYELFLLLIVAFVTTARGARVTRGVLGGFLVCALLYLWFASVDAGLVHYALMA